MANHFELVTQLTSGLLPEGERTLRLLDRAGSLGLSGGRTRSRPWGTQGLLNQKLPTATDDLDRVTSHRVRKLYGGQHMRFERTINAGPVTSGSVEAR